MPTPRRILLRSAKSPFEPLSAEAVMRRRIGGANLGNLVFSDSVHKMLMTADAEVTSTAFAHSLDDADRINEEYDVFVLPFANAFRGEFKSSLKFWAELVNRLKIPVMVIGIGAQSDIDYGFESLRPMDETVKEFVGAVLDKSPAIGVRGHFTGDYLKSLGFSDSDVDVIGCPSMFRYGADFKVEKKASELTPDSHIAMSMTAGTSGDLPGLLSRTAEHYQNLVYIAQDIKDLELMYWGDTSREAGVQRDYPKDRSHPLFEENRVRLYLDPVTWIRGLGTKEFSFGSRIHGNITSLLGGTPSVVLCHDSRTLELSEYFDIPHRRIADLPADADAADLYAEADFTRLNQGHADRFARMTGFVAKNGLQHVYEPGGDGGAAFESRINRVEFPPAVEVWSQDDGAMGYRMGWLKENVDRLTKSAARTAKEVKAAQKRIDGLEAQVRQLKTRQEKQSMRSASLENALYHRAWRKAGQVIKRAKRSE